VFIFACCPCALRSLFFDSIQAVGLIVWLCIFRDRHMVFSSAAKNQTLHEDVYLRTLKTSCRQWHR